MKLLLVLLTVSSLTFGGGYGKPEKGGESTQNNSGGTATTSDYSSTTLITEWDAVASSAARLTLPECSDGGSAQTKDGGISMARLNYICESVMLMKIQLATAKGEIEAAKACKDNSAAQQRHLSYAHGYLDKAKEINARALDYHEDRGLTASWGAWASDLWAWFLGGIGLLVIL